MSAWQGASTASTADGGRGPGRLHIWPHFVVRWLFGRGEEPRLPEASPGPVARFQNICISREAGAGGGAIARLVGQRLGWKVYDNELIEAIAHRMGVPLDEVRSLDELAPSVVQDWLLPLREEYYAPQEAYLDHLAKLIEAIGRAGESILVGRGAGFMLPRETTLSIRVIAPLKVRAQRLAERMGVTVRTARRAARDLDRRRYQFDRTMHRANSHDPHNYDLVLDSNSLGLEIASEIIAHAVVVGRPSGTVASPLLRSPSDRETLEPEPPVPTAELWSAAREPAGTASLPPPPVTPAPQAQAAPPAGDQA
jgi:cytidylate kinase